MKRNTIKWRIFKYNIIFIIVLIAITTIVFNIVIRLYIESNTSKQLNEIASRAEDTALHRGPDFFKHGDGKKFPPPPQIDYNTSNADDILKSSIPYTLDNRYELFGFYFALDRSLREPLSLLNADYILLDSNKKIVISPEEDYFKPSDDILNKVTDVIEKLKNTNDQACVNFSIKNTDYIAIIKPVSSKNTFGLGWIVIYSNLQKVYQLQWQINLILLIILLLSALVTAIFSSIAAKKISAPFSSLNHHIGAIAERNFGTKIHIPVDDELQEFVNNINTMSEKLQSYDKAQKTFLQNASHEFRTPLMSIQSYAEGIKYDVVDKNTASDVIIDETKRLTHLVESVLYLSRLDTIEENYHFSSMNFNDLVNSCIERMSRISATNNIQILSEPLGENVEIYADEEKLSRAFTNVISNCIRYAKTTVKISSKIVSDNKIEITISDDGPGIDANELPNIFERFYKGKKGHFGLGLAICKNIIDKHNGIISAENSESGAVFKVILPAKK